MNEDANNRQFNPADHLLKVQGNRDYLPVSARITWLRTEHKDWGIETEAVALDVERGYAIFRAFVKDETGRIIGTGTKYQDRKGFADFIGKSETGAIGRALGACGYGTDDIDDADLESAKNNAQEQRGSQQGRQQHGPRGQQVGTQRSPGSSARPQTQSTQPNAVNQRPESKPAPPVAQEASSDQEVEERQVIGKECSALIAKLPQELKGDFFAQVLLTYNREFKALTASQLQSLKLRLNWAVMGIKPNTPISVIETDVKIAMRMAHPALEPQVSDEVERIWGDDQAAFSTFMEWQLDQFGTRTTGVLKPDYRNHLLTTLSGLADRK